MVHWAGLKIERELNLSNYRTPNPSALDLWYNRRQQMTDAAKEPIDCASNPWTSLHARTMYHVRTFLVGGPWHVLIRAIH